MICLKFRRTGLLTNTERLVIIVLSSEVCIFRQCLPENPMLTSDSICRDVPDDE